MYLDQIVQVKKQEVELLKQQLTVSRAQSAIEHLPACKGFEQALTVQRRSDMGLIAEVKKASPSKGLIREDFDPVRLAKAYEQAGADCLSVLTDVPHFQGANEYLTAIRAEVNLPILRKEFMIDDLQIYEARMIGADAILLIAAILTTEEMTRMHALARELGMDVLIEVHDEEELARVLTVDSVSLIGINNRNLKTFETDLKTTEKLRGLIPEHMTVVSESGISHKDERLWLKSVGADALLIGEYFMRQDDVTEAVRSFMSDSSEA